MFVNTKDVFTPSADALAKERESLKNARAEMVKEKRCVVCKNTYLMGWNNHGHNDKLTYCKYTNDCVDFSDGKQCKHFKPTEEDA